MSDSLYDMKQKLLQMQNELLKGNEKPEPVSTPAPVTQTSHHVNETKTINNPVESISQNDIIFMIKEMRLNQQKILSLLLEINSKLK